MKTLLTRREMLRLMGYGAAGAALASCAPPKPTEAPTAAPTTAVEPTAVPEATVSSSGRASAAAGAARRQ